MRGGGESLLLIEFKERMMSSSPLKSTLTKGTGISHEVTTRWSLGHMEIRKDKDGIGF